MSSLLPLSPRTDPSGDFVAALGSFGDRPALLTASGSVTYADLAARVAALAERLGATRRLVLVPARNDVDTVVSYLAALAGRHPVLLGPEDGPGREGLVAAYDPDVVLDGGLHERRAGTGHDLHPDLALLLSTSGTTGSPKLVRLSRSNLQTNAEQIATYLQVRGSDVAPTSLPLHYCYGLSVLNSHLLTGAAVLLTDRSVVDPCFWEDFRTAGATTLAGVPHTFDLLDRVGFDRMELPSLRYLTQAGGRMDPDQVRRYAELGQRRGFDLFVMYGQTEATARMTYLPPDLAVERPGAIGVPVPGGSVRLDPVAGAEEGVGELVYRGENVMLGYARTPADLARGRTVHELRTGDLARYDGHGLLEVVGRRSRFAKVLGLRVDLDRAEQLLAGAGVAARCADADGLLAVAVADPGQVPDRVPDPVATVERVAGDRLGLPATAVRVLVLDELPRLASGKPDHAAVARLAREASPRPCACTRAGCACSGAPRDPRAASRADVRALYADLLRREGVTDDDSFVALGGDSLTYVELSVRLEQLLGRLPADWHLAPVRDLVPAAPGAGDAPTEAVEPSRSGQPAPPRAGRRWRTVETGVVLRALAILAIVGSHGNLFVLLGGAHVLLAVSGFNVGRFALASPDRRDRVRSLLTGAARIAVPAVAWIGLVTVLTGDYPWRTVLLLNGAVGPPEWSEPAWHYWFLEVLVALLLLTAALVSVPRLHRLERAHPFWVPFALAVAGLVFRYDLVSLRGGDEIHRAHVLLWLFALGWAIARAGTTRQRLLASALVVLTVPGFFDDPAREAFVVLGVLALTWVRQVRVPAFAVRPLAALAGASLYIYLCHWQVYPHLEDDYPLAAVALSLAAGLLLERTVSATTAAVRRLRPVPAAH